MVVLRAPTMITGSEEAPKISQQDFRWGRCNRGDFKSVEVKLFDKLLIAGDNSDSCV